MGQELDVSNPADDPAVSEPRPRPVVVVQYRRGWPSTLSTPLLILVAAGAILSHRIRSEDWRGLADYFGGSPPPELPTASVPPPPPAVAAPSPVVFNVVEAPEAGPPEPPSPPRPEFKHKPMTPIAPLPGLAPEPDARVQAASIWDDIRRESERKRQEARALERVKDALYEEDRKLSEIKKAERARREREALEDGRLAFHESLRRSLAEANGRPGEAVRDLCERHGVPIGSGWMRTASKAATTVAGRRDRIDRLRRGGTPEPLILVELIRIENANRVARSGPRTQEEVVVRAARQLLSAPLAPPPGPLRPRGPQ